MNPSMGAPAKTSGCFHGALRASLDCTDCHGGDGKVVTYRSPRSAPDCAGRHESNFRSGPNRKTQTPQTNYNVSELRDCSGACHIYEDVWLTTIRTLRPGPQHRVADRGFD